MTFRKEHYLYLALVVPVFMILVTALSVYFFRIELESRYNFIYALSEGPSELCQARLQAQLHGTESPPVPSENQEPDCSKLKIYLYDFKSKTSTPLTLSQARLYPLFSGLNLQQSPEGFTVQSYCLPDSSLGWWGWTRMDSSWSSICLRKNNRQERLPIETVNTQEGYRKFIFLGWIKDTPR